MKRLYLVGLFVLSVMAVNAQQKTQIDAKFGKGIKFTAPDNSFSLKFGLRIQPLFTTNFRDFEKLDNPELNQVQMMIRRARLKFDGHVFDPRVTYKFELAFGNRNIGGISTYTNNGARVILDAVVKYQFHKNFSIWFGQTKLPGNRERVVSSQKLQFVDRSIVNSRYNLDRDMGFQIHGKHKIGDVPMYTAFAWSMGDGRNITTYNSGGFEYTGRVEFLPLGAFSSKKGHYSEADLDREQKPKLAVGVSYDYNDKAARARGNQGDWMLPIDTSGAPYLAQNSLTTLWFDLIFKYKGWSFMTEYANRTSKTDPVVYNDDGTEYGKKYFTGSGINFQLGYVFKSNWELAGRTSFMRPEVSVAKQYNQYTFVVSKYFVGHSLKIQSDITYSDYSTINGDTESDPLMFRFQVEVAL